MSFNYCVKCLDKNKGLLKELSENSSFIDYNNPFLPSSIHI